MSYQLTLPINLGSSKTGLTLYAQLIDSLGAQVGADITTGFVERGNGMYLVPLTIPDDFDGIIEVYDDADASLQASAPVDGPSNADALSQRLLQGGGDGADTDGRTFRNALRPGRNKVVLTGSSNPYTLTVYKEDDSTIAWTGQVVLGARNPMMSVDPG